MRNVQCFRNVRHRLGLGPDSGFLISPAPGSRRLTARAGFADQENGFPKECKLLFRKKNLARSTSELCQEKW